MLKRFRGGINGSIRATSAKQKIKLSLKQITCLSLLQRRLGIQPSGWKICFCSLELWTTESKMAVYVPGWEQATFLKYKKMLMYYLLRTWDMQIHTCTQANTHTHLTSVCSRSTSCINISRILHCKYYHSGSIHHGMAKNKQTIAQKILLCISWVWWSAF